MIFKAGCRCDVCGFLAKTVKKMDKFTPFMLPKNGAFPGVASSKNPKVPITLHVCPECKPKMAHAFRSGDVSLLPSGPLKQWIDKTTIRHIIMKGAKDQITKRVLH